MTLLDQYAEVVGPAIVNHLAQLAAPLQGARVVHVNSTRVGGGVAEILAKLVPLTRELGVDARWEVIAGDQDFFQCTKAMHNALQGSPVDLSGRLIQAYEDTTARNAEQLAAQLADADFVFVHDPQPARLLQLFPGRSGKWIWRCHIDVSHPHRPVWKYLRGIVGDYDASVFSLAAFAQALPHPEYIVPPSIDPLSDKNVGLDQAEIDATRERFGIDPQRPLVLQISRFDRFKDPLGVIRAFRLAQRYLPRLQLVLAGGGASDDPEGDVVLQEVRSAAAEDPDIKILLLPAGDHRTVNALQRAADIVLQKSIREGFGLTVTEAMWKSRPVIGGNTGGIRLQVFDHHTGYLVSTPEGAALRIRHLLSRPARIAEMGEKAHNLVRDNFLITRQLREYLTLMVALLHAAHDRIELG